MRSPSPILTGFVAALVAFVALSASASRADASDSADDCVQLSSNPVTKGISLDVANHCDRALACRLTWTVQCESATGKITRSRAGSAQFALAASASGSALASTSDCSDGWRVDDVRWACNPTR
jgi:hypothetical protein